MRRRLVCWLGCAVALLTLTASASQAGEPVAGIDVGAGLPISSFRDTAKPGAVLAPFVGYRFGDHYAFTPMIQPQFTYFATDVNFGPEESDITSIFAICAGGRFSLLDEGREVYLGVQGGYYSDITGPLNDKGEGFNISGGFNYEFWRGTSLGVFIRRDQSSMRAARGTHDDLIYLTTGLSVQHRFLPAPPPPPPPVVAAAPPPAPTPVPVKKKIVLRGVNFDFDKATIRPDARPILDQAAETLKQEGDIGIAVEGHTDSVGSDEYNQRLSVRRAKAVKDYLAGKGIDPSRMSVTGYGESKPVASNDTAEGRAQNRRVELRVE
jgi:outer membrane protein OmpA-like peptidoglycan-associated protein